MAEKRKNGSILVALLSGLAVGGIGVCTLVHASPSSHEDLINAGASLIFALVLLWWAFSGEEDHDSFRWQLFYSGRHWGIGFPTVTMVVTVLTALVAIFTLTHELYKKESNKSAAEPSAISRTKDAK
jgi:hypothetical protein